MTKGFRSLPRNARTSIMVEPLWSLFGPTVIYFMPLYQRSMGLSEVQMGIVNSAGIAAGLVFYLLAAPITNKLGRKWTSFIFDFIAWTLPMILWIFSRSLAWFLAAAIANAVVRIVIISWNLLISEDANDDQRSTIYGLINVIGTFGGITTLVGGLFIERFGLEPALRVIFIAGAVSMSLMFILRLFGSSETGTGIYIKERSRNVPLAKLIVQQVPEAAQALKDPFFLKMAGIYTIANAILSIDFFRILYMKEEKAIPALAVSTVPALSALASLFVFFAVLPRQKALKNRDQLANAFLACLAAQILFIFMPSGSILAVVLIFPSLQVNFVLLQTWRDTVFMNSTEAAQKSERFSLIQALMMLLCIPAGYLAGLLYALAPQLPFALASLLYLGGYFLAKDIAQHEPKHATLP